MAKRDGPIPQEKGQLIRPSRRPPTTVTVETPDRPERSSLHKILKHLASFTKRIFAKPK
jgi:hypothetical protein